MRESLTGIQVLILHTFDKVDAGEHRVASLGKLSPFQSLLV